MRRVADHLDTLASIEPRVVYVDLDGTLLGPGGSLFASASGGVTPAAAEALGELHRRGVQVVPTSGRTEAQVREAARLLGAGGFIAELGGIVARNGSVERFHGAAPPGIPPAAAMVRGGGAGLLLERYAGVLEPHTPWASAAREVTLLFRGRIDVQEARGVLEASGYRWLDVHDNGIVRGRYPHLDPGEVHVYHLTPRRVSKRLAIAADLAGRGMRTADAILVGDAPTDVDAAGAVAAGLVVSNGAWAARAAGEANVYVTEASHGDGFAEAIRAVTGT